MGGACQGHRRGLRRRGWGSQARRFERSRAPKTLEERGRDPGSDVSGRSCCVGRAARERVPPDLLRAQRRHPGRGPEFVCGIDASVSRRPGSAAIASALGRDPSIAPPCHPCPGAGSGGRGTWHSQRAVVNGRRTRGGGGAVQGPPGAEAPGNLPRSSHVVRRVEANGPAVAAPAETGRASRCPCPALDRRARSRRAKGPPLLPRVRGSLPPGPRLDRRAPCWH